MDETLENIFEKQIALQKIAFNKELPNHEPKLVSYFALGLVGEVGEVLQADKTWKPFNKGTRNEWSTLEELADCWLFLINLTLAEGYDCRTIKEMIHDKQEVVFERIKREKSREKKNGTNNND